MSAMGFYPVNPCGGIYVIGSPLLPGFTINLENGKTFQIKAHGLSEENIYIQSVRLNGQPMNNVWISHADIVNGGILEFEMGPSPVNGALIQNPFRWRMEEPENRISNR